MFTLKIKTRNAAFNDGGPDGMQRNPAPEVARLLREVADELDTYLAHSTAADGELRDYNGNAVGEWKLTPR